MNIPRTLQPGKMFCSVATGAAPGLLAGRTSAVQSLQQTDGLKGSGKTGKGSERR